MEKHITLCAEEHNKLFIDQLERLKAENQSLKEEVDSLKAEIDSNMKFNSLL